MAALMLLTVVTANAAKKIYKPWDNGRLVVSENQRYIVHENGKPFFWLGNTAWLLPERLNRDEVGFFLSKDREAGYNVEQIQVLNAIPTSHCREAHGPVLKYGSHLRAGSPPE